MPVALKLQMTQQLVEITVQPGIAARYVLTDHDQGDILEKSVTVVYQVTLLEASHFELFIALTQVQNCSIRIELDLQGAGAHADVTILYALSGQQNVKINTVQKHQGKKTISSFVARGIVTDQASVAYQGMISLQPGSLQADAKQEHTTIVLSKQAKVVSIPSIEVLHHDVQCSHGAAIGQFDEQQLWYLQSRGLQKTEAYKMLVHSFFAQYISRFLDVPNLLENLCQKIL